jgi:plastocyanin
MALRGCHTLATMSRLRMALLLALVTALAGAPSATADQTVNVVDYEFLPDALSVQVGEKVTWTFTNGGHTTTSRPGQPESWNSDLKDAGQTFERTFNRPGRYRYICIPHESIGMTGVVQVGNDDVKKTFQKLRARRYGRRRAKLTFTLNEPARMTLKLRGPSDKTIRRRRLRAGRKSFPLGKLRPGAYRATLTLVDDFEKKATGKKRFRIR